MPSNISRKPTMCNPQHAFLGNIARLSGIHYIGYIPCYTCICIYIYNYIYIYIHTYIYILRLVMSIFHWVLHIQVEPRQWLWFVMWGNCPQMALFQLGWLIQFRYTVHMYIYIYIYINTHTHIYIYSYYPFPSLIFHLPVSPKNHFR